MPSAKDVCVIAERLLTDCAGEIEDSDLLLANALLSLLKNGGDACNPTAAGIAALLEKNLVDMSTF